MTKDWTNVVTELCATCPLFWIVLFQFFICPGLTKIANHTIFIYGKMPVIHFSCTFIKNTKLHERSMVSYFSYMEIVWLAFSHKPKKKFFIFLNLIFQNVLNLFVTRSWFRGGAGADASLQGFDPLPTQRVPPLYYFEKFIFGDGP